MALDNRVPRCENVDELQSIINTLLVARTKLFRRKRGDTGAVHDFINGQSAILSALKYLCAMQNFTEQQQAEVIQTVWRRYGSGPTLGNGQACQYLLRFLHEKFSNDPRLEWPGWEELNW